MHVVISRDMIHRPILISAAAASRRSEVSSWVRIYEFHLEYPSFIFEQGVKGGFVLARRRTEAAPAADRVPRMHREGAAIGGEGMQLLQQLDEDRGAVRD